MKHNLIRFFILFFIILSFSAITGQTPALQNLVNQDGDTLVLKAIPLSGITDSIESTYARIKKIEQDLIPGEELLKFDSTYAIALKNLEIDKNKIITKDEHTSIREIDQVLNDWSGYNSILNEWKEKINDRIKTLELDDFQTEVLIRTWDMTLSAAREGGVPADVLTNVTQLNRVLNALKRNIVLDKTESLRKQNKITELLLLVDEVNTFLSQKRKQYQSDYLRQDAPPIWRAIDSTASISQVKIQFIKTAKNNFTNFLSFYKANQSILIVRLFIFLLLFIGCFFLYKAAKIIVGPDSEENLKLAKSVISHYVLSALVISIFISQWFYVFGDILINDFLLFFNVLLAIYLLPLFADKKLRPFLYGILILFLLNEVQVFLPNKTFFSRIILFTETLLSGWLIAKMVAKGQIISTELKKRNWEIVLKLTPVFFIFLAVAFVGNIFGLLNFSTLLTNTVVNSLFNLITLIVFARVLYSIIAILLRTPFMQSSNIIKKGLASIEARTYFWIQFLIILLWIKNILELLGVYEIISEWFVNITMAKWEVGNTTIELGGILAFFIVIFITYFASRITKSLLKDEVYPRVKLPRGIPGAISMIISYLIAGYGFYIALIYAGVNLSSFGLIAGALGVGIGFGLQGIVANFIAGIVIAFERPIQVGDTIEIGTMMGQVDTIGVRSCTIRTFDGSEVIVPNSSLITNDVTNWTLTDRRIRRDINIGVAYGSDLHEVMELLIKVANKHPEVLKIPAPLVLFDGFGDNSLNFRVRIWTTMDGGLITQSDVAVAIYDALNEAGIQIPFPQRDLHLRSIDSSIKGFGNENLVKPKKQQKTKSKKSTAKKEEENNDIDFDKDGDTEI